MRVFDLINKLMKFCDTDDKVELVSSEGIDEDILGKQLASYFKTEVVPSHCYDRCFTIAVKLNHGDKCKYIMQDVIVSEHDL